VVRDLQLPCKTKAYVAGILGMGGLAAAAVIIRIPYLLILLHNYLDFLYYSPDAVNWSTVELGLGITAAAYVSMTPQKYLSHLTKNRLATLRPLLYVYFSY